MVTIPGASGFLGAATLANVRGIGAQAPTLLGEGSATGLLESGRNLAAGGFGISSSARALNQQFLNNSTDINAMFSLAVGPDATIEGAQQIILALRGSIPESQLSRAVRGDDGGVSAPKTGKTVDTEA